MTKETQAHIHLDGAVVKNPFSKATESKKNREKIVFYSHALFAIGLLFIFLMICGYILHFNSDHLTWNYSFHETVCTFFHT